MRHKNLFFKCLFFILLVALLGFAVTEVKNQNIPTEKQIALVSPNPNLEEMVGVSPCIFTGTVVGIRYGKHGKSYYPFTFVTFKDLKFIKKTDSVPLDKNGALEISYIGGMLDDNSILEVSGTPIFDIGNSYLVFLRGGGWRLSPIPGIDNGLFVLRGRQDEDPFLLDISGVPISGFDNGYRVFSSKKTPEIEKKQSIQDLKEEGISIEKAKKLGIILEKPPIGEEIDKVEREARAKEELVEKVIKREPDRIDQFELQWSKVMRLSELTKKINELSIKTQGKFKDFEEIFLIPVPFPEKGKMKPIKPTKK